MRVISDDDKARGVYVSSVGAVRIGSPPGVPVCIILYGVEDTQLVNDNMER